MISIDSEIEQPDKDWNKRMLDFKIGTTHQTTEQADFEKTVRGWNHNFLKFIDNKGNIVGQNVISLVPKFDKPNKIFKIFKKLPVPQKTLYKWRYGPIIFDLEHINEIRGCLLNFIKNDKAEGTEPPLCPGIFSQVKNPFKLKPWATFLIDLKISSQEIWSNFEKHSARKNIERANKKGVYVKKINRNILSDYLQLRKDPINEIQKKLSLEKLQIHWDKFQSIGRTGFLAYYLEKPIGGIMINPFNGYLNESGIARSTLDLREKLYAQDLLKWEIIKWGIENHHSYYDLTGVNPNPTSQKENGILRYKRKWGGENDKF